MSQPAPDASSATPRHARPGRPAPAAPRTPELTPEQTALVAEACTRSAVVWVRPHGADRASCAWHVWMDGAVLVVHGVGEQQLPVLTGVVELTVPSKESRQRLLVVQARVDHLPPGTPAWQAAADALAAKRLNATDPDGQRERWATGTLISRLVPLTVQAQGAGAVDEPSGAVPPPSGPGTTRAGYRPWHLGGRRRRSG